MSQANPEHLLEARLGTVLQWVRVLMRSQDVPFCALPGRARRFQIEQRGCDIVLSQYAFPARYMDGPTHPWHHQLQYMDCFPLMTFLADPQGRGTVMQEYDVQWLEEMQERNKHLDGVCQSDKSTYSDREICDQKDRTERLTEFIHQVRSHQRATAARLLERFNTSAESDGDEAERKGIAAQRLPEWFPKTPKYQEKWWESYCVIKNTERECLSACHYDYTGRLMPSSDELCGALEELWGKRPDPSTVSRIQRAGREGIYRRLGFRH